MVTSFFFKPSFILVLDILLDAIEPPTSSLCFSLGNDTIVLSLRATVLYRSSIWSQMLLLYKNIIHIGKWLLFLDNSSYANACIFIENHSYVSPVEIYSHVHSLPYAVYHCVGHCVKRREHLSKRHLWEADCRLLNVQLILNNTNMYMFLECWAQVNWEMARLCMSNTLVQRFSNLFRLQNCYLKGKKNLATSNQRQSFSDIKLTHLSETSLPPPILSLSQNPLRFRVPQSIVWKSPFQSLICIALHSIFLRTREPFMAFYRIKKKS